MLTAMRKIFIASIFIFTFCAFTFGQNSNCPTISVTGPSAVVQPGEAMDFTASVSGFDASKVGYKWTVSENRPFQGQGTNKIKVKVKSFSEVKGAYEDIIKATVEISNLPEGCSNTVSETGVLACSCTPIILDEFGDIPLNEQKLRLSVIKDELEKNSEYVAYIIFYRSEKNNDINKYSTFIKNFLVKEKKFPKKKFP